MNIEKTMLILTVLWVGLLTSTATADSVVVFNEIMYHPRGTEVEWIELYNQMGVDIDMTGWSLQGGISFAFPEDTFVPAGGFVVVASAPESLQTQVPEGISVLGPFFGRLSNGGETIRLVNNSGRLLNEVDYDDGGDWPAGPDGGGVTLAKLHANRESDTPAHWTWSAQQGGSPGAANFPSAETLLRRVRFNEMTSVTAEAFYLELVRVGNAPFNETVVHIEVIGQANADCLCDVSALASEGYLTLNPVDLGFVPGDGDLLLLWSEQGNLLDAVTADDRLRGCNSDGSGDWLFPERATPGKENAFDLNHNIVINEIMYHPMTVPPAPASVDTVTLVPEVTPARVKVPVDGSLGLDWTGGNEPFADDGWTDGTGDTTGVGYEIGSGYEPYLGTDVVADMFAGSTSVYIRIPFTVIDLNIFSELLLSMRYDDGFVAYLNGIEVARANAPENAVWNDNASQAHADDQSVTWQVFDISPHLSALRLGDNILAIHGLNVSDNSSDCLIQPRLVAVEASSLELPDLTQEESRIWVELYNKGELAVNLSGWRFIKGVDFVFPEDTILEAGEYLVVAGDAGYLSKLHPEARIVGDFSGNLANEGEALLLIDDRGNPADEVRYYDGGAWSKYADGGGCSLELRDVAANNNRAEAWAASDELPRSTWQTYSFRAIASRSPVGNDGLYSEFVMGLLDQGEILIDDIEVIEDPDGAAVNVLANSDFSQGTQRWRIIGNHSTTVVVPDPEDQTNPVLHLMASGPTEHMSNHAETTLADNRWIDNGQTYEIRFRARWVAGTPLLNTRLFFNRVAHTFRLHSPERSGTPGKLNSRAVPNMGPTFTQLHHTPVVPTQNQVVTVTVRAEDPDPVTDMTLWYREDEGPWDSVPMALSANELYIGQIPGRSGETIVQFYVEGRDSLGATTWYPAAGSESFAQYQVLGKTGGRRDFVITGQVPRNTGVHNYRLVMRSAQWNELYERTNRMSNRRLGATLIVNENDVYYNVGVRLKSSEHGRPKDPRIGFSLRFDPQQRFRGMHKTIAFDRSNGQQVGQQEMLLHAAMNRFGGDSKYHDLGYLMAPDPRHSSGVEVQLARYDTLYCEESFGKAGGDGTLFEYELIYPLTETVGNDPEGLKIPQEGSGVQGLSLDTYLGQDKELYRWHMLIKNHRDEDNYAPVMRMTAALSRGGSVFDQAIADVLDVEQWLRSFAMGSTYGLGDNWISNAQHNAMFYHRPTDDKIVYFLHDMDYQNNVSAALKRNSILRKITENPRWDRSFYAYVYDFIRIGYSRTYLSYWSDHYAQLLPEQNWSAWLNYVDNRANNVRGQLQQALPQEIPFTIDTVTATIDPSGQALLQGQGWINVRQLRVLETGALLEIVWLDWTHWQALIQDEQGPGVITVEAYDALGTSLGTDTVELVPSVVR